MANALLSIRRLRHNVIKTGVRMISLSYSRISLSDVAEKLLLDSPEDAEFIIAKVRSVTSMHSVKSMSLHSLLCCLTCLQAIRDGVIEATIDHEKGYVKSKDTVDVYSTREPMAAFHQRISFCLDMHNQSVKVRACS